MQRNAIDGASTGPPQLEVMQQNGAVIVANGTSANPVDPPWLSHVAANVVLVKRQTCAEHKSLCAKMGQAMVQASAYMHDHAKETMAILAKRLNIQDRSVLEDTYKETLTSTPLAPVLDAKGLETADQLNVAAGFMPVDQKLPSYEGIFTNEYVK
jgi:ABC-type nitrate/sulfonate/bicarbonate transport system substrate-binding protein